MTKARISELLDEKSALERDLHALRCKYGDLFDLVSDVVCDYETGQSLDFLPQLVALYRKQQTQD